MLHDYYSNNSNSHLNLRTYLTFHHTQAQWNLWKREYHFSNIASHVRALTWLSLKGKSMGQPYSLKLVYPLLKILGAWPKSSPSSVLSTILKCCLISICYLIQLMVLIPGILYIFLKEANLGGKIKMFVPHMNGITQVSKYTILLRQIKEFNIILKEVKRDYSLATDKNMWIFTTRAYIGHKMMIAIAIAMYSSGVGYRMILPFLKGRILLPDNTTVRLLPCPGYYMFLNEQVTPNYEIIFTIQVLGGFLNYTTLCGTTGITTMLCLHMCSLLEILINKMNDLTCQSDECETIVRKKLADIVEYQMKIIEWVKIWYIYFYIRKEIVFHIYGAHEISFQLFKSRRTTHVLSLFLRNSRIRVWSLRDRILPYHGTRSWNINYKMVIFNVVV